MKKTSTPAGKSRMKFQEKTPKAPAKSGGKSALLDPALCGALLGVLSVLALLLLKDKGTDAGELLLLGRYINEDLAADNSFNWTGRSALIAGLLPGALLWSIFRKDLSISFSSGMGENSFSSVMTAILRGVAGGALMMAGIQLSGFSVWAAMQKAVQLSGGAALFLISAAVTAFVLTTGAGLFRRKKN
jgi:hypothetical protein